MIGKRITKIANNFFKGTPNASRMVPKPRLAVKALGKPQISPSKSYKRGGFKLQSRLPGTHMLSHRFFCSGRPFKVTVPLPNHSFSSFSLTSTHTVQNLVDSIKQEDKSVLTASVISSTGERLASTNPLSSIENGFKISLIGPRFEVTTTFGSGTQGFSPQEWQVKPTSGATELSPQWKLQMLKQEIIPMMKEKQEMDIRAEKRANLLSVAVLGYLVTQMSILARLTWWEFNWDIMEPVTYFVTFSTAILGYFYFLFTKRDYNYPDAYKGYINSYLKKIYNSNPNFDVDRYFTLEHEIKKIEPLALLEIEDEIEKSQNSK